MKSEELTVGKKLELIDEVLTRSVGEFVDPDGKFREKLIAKAQGRYSDPIVIKYGVDPTRPDIHLGHAVCFRKLRLFQDLGCKVLFLVGDFTALIGDPTGKSKVRPEIAYQEIVANMKTYLDQVGRILDISYDQGGNIVDDEKFTWLTNSDWYVGINDVLRDERLTSEEKARAWENTRIQRKITKDTIHNVSLRDFLSFLRKITYSKLIQRDLFQERLNSHQELFLHELMYPVLQGLDSNLICKIYGSCDLEIGGTDQTFNMLMGRDMMEAQEIGGKQEPQSILSIKLLEGLDGKQKMSKSLDNYIGITDVPNKMFTRVMSIPDTSIVNYFELATDVPMSEVRELEEKMKSGEIHPRDLKVRLAKEIVTIYHGAEAAENAEEARPSQAPPETTIIEFMVAEKLASSKSEARRKIEQGGVELDGEKVTDWQMELNESHNDKILKVGKKDFVKIVF